MSIARYNRPRDEQFYWWGPGWSRRRSLSLGELILSGTLTMEEAGLLTSLMRRGISIFVISMSSGAGKSTLLNALLDDSSNERNRAYLRGAYETFDILETADPQRTCLLANEISPHLPIYLWGPGVATFLTAASDGFQLGATAHASDAPAFIHLLASAPLSVPIAVASLPKLVVTLDAWQNEGTAHRQLQSIVFVTPGSSPQATALWTIGKREGRGEVTNLDFDAARRLLEAAGVEAGELDEEVAGRIKKLGLAAGGSQGRGDLPGVDDST